MTLNQNPPDVLLHKSTCKTLGSKIGGGTIEMILTEPPLTQHMRPSFEELGTFAVHALKSGGSLFVQCDQHWMLEAMNSFRESGLRYHWTLCLFSEKLRSVFTLLQHGHIRSLWKPLLWFIKYRQGVKYPPIFDMMENTVHIGLSHNHLIERLTTPGGRICDPFVGGGDVAVSALSANRAFVGGDIHPNALHTTQSRLWDEFPSLHGCELIARESPR